MKANKLYSDEYKQFTHIAPIACCWACGATALDKPPSWFAPWLIERSHVVNKPRRHDSRAIILLCSWCHKRHHGERFPSLPDPPKLNQANQLWIKRRIDPTRYCKKFLESCCIGRLPEPEPLHEWYLERIAGNPILAGLYESDCP